MYESAIKDVHRHLGELTFAAAYEKGRTDVARPGLAGAGVNNSTTFLTIDSSCEEDAEIESRWVYPT